MHYDQLDLFMEVNLYLIVLLSSVWNLKSLWLLSGLDLETNCTEAKKKKRKKKKRKNTLDLYRAVYFMSGNTCSNEYGEKIVKSARLILLWRIWFKKLSKLSNPLTFTWFHGILLNLQFSSLHTFLDTSEVGISQDHGIYFKKHINHSIQWYASVIIFYHFWPELEKY